MIRVICRRLVVSSRFFAGDAKEQSSGVGVATKFRRKEGGKQSKQKGKKGEEEREGNMEDLETFTE
jgi:hypothetical protein